MSQLSTFLSELKRRRVLRLVAVYPAVVLQHTLRRCCAASPLHRQSTSGGNSLVGPQLTEPLRWALLHFERRWD